MIETSIPGINVVELMERVRVEAARIKTAASRPRNLDRPLTPALPSVPDLPAPPPLTCTRNPEPKNGKIANLLERARDNSDRPGVPKIFRRLFRRQGAFNRLLLESHALLLRTNSELHEQLRFLTIEFEVQGRWLHALAVRHGTDSEWMNAAALILPEAAAHGPAIESLKDSADEMQATINAHHNETLHSHDEIRSEIDQWNRDSAQRGADWRTLAERLENIETESTNTTAQMVELRSHSDQMDARLAASRTESERTLERRLDDMQRGKDAAIELAEALQNQARRDGEHLRNLQAEVDRLGLHLTNAETEFAVAAEAARHLKERLDAEAGERHGVQRVVSQLEERITSNSAFMRGELSQVGALLRTWLDGEQKKSGRGPAHSQGARKAPGDHRLDSFYLSFEDRFRGPRALIKQRIAFYLPYLKAAAAGSPERPIVDVGCGRGEWLEFLKENALEARGVDLNSSMVAVSRERGLDAVQNDAIEYLRSLPENSQGAITGFHIIEHLPLDVLLDLISESRRVLHPGGVAIFESPNCKNLVVGACNFNIDPTHRNPVFPDTAQFMLDLHGFERVEIQYLTPVDTQRFPQGSTEGAVLNELLYGPQDFAVIGHKPVAA
jgi:SAM-dependent methyltransferase